MYLTCEVTRKGGADESEDQPRQHQKRCVLEVILQLREVRHVLVRDKTVGDEDDEDPYHNKHASYCFDDSARLCVCVWVGGVHSGAYA